MQSPFRESALPEAQSPFMQQPISVIETALDVFGFIPEDGDERWAFLYRYDETKRNVGFKSLHFANARRATYLGDAPSYSAGYVSSISEENCLQLDRALDNLSHAPNVRNGYQETAGNFEAFGMQLARTDRLTTDPTKAKRIVTPCPEAIYQIRLDYGGYLARVGFNLHEEADSTIFSIVNIQGTPGSRARNAKFETEFGISPFSLLVERAVAVASAQPTPFAVRGMINPEQGNSQLYWCALNSEGVAMHHAVRKPARPTEATE